MIKPIQYNEMYVVWIILSFDKNFLEKAKLIKLIKILFERVQNRDPISYQSAPNKRSNYKYFIQSGSISGTIAIYLAYPAANVINNSSAFPNTLNIGCFAFRGLTHQSCYSKY